MQVRRTSCVRTHGKSPGLYWKEFQKSMQSIVCITQFVWFYGAWNYLYLHNTPQGNPQLFSSAPEPRKPSALNILCVPSTLVLHPAASTISAPSSWHSDFWEDGMQHAFACRSVHFSKPFLGKHRKPSESRSSKSIVPILSRTGCVGISHHIPSWFHGPHFSYSEEVFQMGKNCLEFANNPSKSHHGLLDKALWL